MNKTYPLVIRKDLEHAVELDNVQGRIFDGTFTGMTVDEAVKYWQSQAVRTDDIDESLSVFLENDDLLPASAIAIIQYLLKHKDRENLCLIKDGSYYSHRIWLHTNGDVIWVKPEIEWGVEELHDLRKEMEGLGTLEQIDLLFNSFEVVYIQMPIVKTRGDIESWLAWEKADRLFDEWY